MPVPPAALAQYQSGRFEAAAALLRRAVQRSPRDHESQHLLGACLSQVDQHEAAVFAFERAIAEAPGRADYRANFAEALKRAERLDRAEREAEEATRLDAHFAPGFLALGSVRRELGKHASAIPALERAVALDDGLVMAHVHLADAHLSLGRPERALEASAGAVRADPGNYLHAVTRATFHLFASTVTPADLLAAHRAVAEALARVPVPAGPTRGAGNLNRHNEAHPRPLRVAYLSPDLIEHSVVRFLEPILDHHDRSAFEPVAYSASAHEDATTQRLKPKFARWRRLDAPDEAAIARLLVDDAIDIAIDLAGHTANSIVYPLRRGIVPVQATYLGYAGSTGLPGVRFRFVDAHTDPPGPALGGGLSADEQASEQLIRLDPCFVCFRRPEAAPDVAGPPSDRAGGAVTFGSFNFLGKLSARTKRLWASVLNAVPGSRLLLKDSALEHAEVRAVVAEDFAAAGLDPGRIEMLGRVADRAGHLALYGRVDVALDPFPYHGTTTTCEALWMGVPVVTLAGTMHHARVGVSLMHAVGHGEWVASDEAAYVRVAAELALDVARRRALRAELRPRMAVSPLCDEAGFTRRFEAALLECWREAVANNPA